jgi:asparagine synthase (glutamine-hydrolysing)
MCGIWATIGKNVQITPQILDAFNNVKNRGPDTSTLHLDKNYILGFHRLSINDLSINGNQPFHYSTEDFNYTLICNGEIYNYDYLMKNFGIISESTSDCAVLLPLFIKLGENFFKFNNLLRGEYALLIIKSYRKENRIEFFFSTDPFSVRPLFWVCEGEKLYVSSTLSGLSQISPDVKRLDGGHQVTGYFDFKDYNQPPESELVGNIYNKSYHIETSAYYDIQDISYSTESRQMYINIVNTLIDCVKVRLHSERNIGCLLSGGLDSSLVAAIASSELSKRGKRLRTFSIGIEGGTDLKYARMVADHINSIHTEYLFTPDIGLQVIDDVIKATETYDITTIRASVGQYLLAKAISKDTDIKVILNGDGADEVQMGYLYFYLHPDIKSAYQERNKLLKQIHQFDGLRVDRNISYHGLEARVPFLDVNFVNLFYQISPNLLVPNKLRMEKYLIRKAFETIVPDLLPKEVLWRKKEAFSDGVSSQEKSWYLILKEYYKEKVEDFNTDTIDGIKPHCHESYYYRIRFDELFNNNHKVIPRYWLPNWTNACDPSARTLSIYTD